LALSLFIMSVIVLITLLLILFFKESLLNLLNVESIGNFIYLIPFSILIAGLNQSFNYWSNRKEYFKSISSSQISQSLSIGITQPALGYVNIFGGLIIGNLVGRVVSTFILVDKFFKNDKENLNYIKKSIMIEQMKKYKDFPLVNSLHAFSDIIRTSGSVMLISSFFGSAVLGFYALSLRVLQVPVGIIGSALGQVLYQKFSSMHNNNENLYPYVKKTVIKLFLLALPIFTFLYLIAPDLFAFVFGEKWRVAGEYSQLLVPYLFMNFILSPFSSLPIILGKQKEIFYIALLGNLLFVSILLLFHSLIINSVLGILSITMSIYYLFVFHWFYKVLKK